MDGNKKENKIRKPRRPVSLETRMKISEKRRARPKDKQPRNISQSSKRKSLYEELKEDYKKLPTKERKEVMRWLEENKYELGHIDNPRHSDEVVEKNMEMGVTCEFTEMYSRTYERKMGDILFNGTEIDDFRDSNDLVIDGFDDEV